MTADTVVAFLTDPNAHPLTWPVLGALLALLTTQLWKAHIIPWTVPPKWNPAVAYATSFVSTVAPMILVGSSPVKALLSAGFGSLMPMGAYSLLVRPVLASPPASVSPEGLAASHTEEGK